MKPMAKNKTWCERCYRKMNPNRAQRCQLDGCTLKDNVVPLNHRLPSPPISTDKTYELVVGEVQTGLIQAK